MPDDKDDRIRKIKVVSQLKPHQLTESYYSNSLPVLKQMKQQKGKWGNESTAPEYTVHDEVYKSIEESCMVLNHNKQVYEDVYGEMNQNFKFKVQNMLRQTKSDQWMQSKMPKIKKRNMFFSKRQSVEKEDTSNLEFYKKTTNVDYDPVNHNLASQLLLNEIKNRRLTRKGTVLNETENEPEPEKKKDNSRIIGP